MVIDKQVIFLPSLNFQTRLDFCKGRPWGGCRGFIEAIFCVTYLEILISLLYPVLTAVMSAIHLCPPLIFVKGCERTDTSGILR